MYDQVHGDKAFELKLATVWNYMIVVEQLEHFDGTPAYDEDQEDKHDAERLCSLRM